MILNLTPDHLARHGTMDAYLDAKLRIFERQAPSAVRLTPAAIPPSMPSPPGHGRSSASAGGSPRPRCLVRSEGQLWLVDDRGRPSCCSIGGSCGSPGTTTWRTPWPRRSWPATAAPGATAFGRDCGPIRAWRTASRLCGEKAGVRAYNDSKGTNVDATVTAIKALPGPLVLLLGGQDKGTVLRALAQAPWRASCAGWSSWARPSPSWKRSWETCPTTTLQPFDEAVAAALAPGPARRPGAAVPRLRQLRPVQNFEERGDRFEALVRAWAKG